MRIFTLILLSAGIYFLNIHAVRAEISGCGHVERKYYEDLYDLAQKNQYNYDIKEKIEGICTRHEEYKTWEKDIKKTNKYKRWRNEILDNTEKSMKVMKAQLLILGTWNEADGANDKENALKRAKTDEKKIQIQNSLIKLENDLTKLVEFKTQYNSQPPKN